MPRTVITVVEIYFVAAQYAPCAIIPAIFDTGLIGYWTAGQRVDPTKCQNPHDKTEFRWKPDNGTAIPFDPSWGWQSSDPSCSGERASSSPLYLIEACVGIIINNWQMVDMSCYYPRCPICELEM